MTHQTERENKCQGRKIISNNIIEEMVEKKKSRIHEYTYGSNISLLFFCQENVQFASQAKNALDRQQPRLRLRGLLLRFYFISWPLGGLLFDLTSFSLWEPLRNATPCIVSNLSLHKLTAAQSRGCRDHRAGLRRSLNRAVASAFCQPRRLAASALLALKC